MGTKLEQQLKRGSSRERLNALLTSPMSPPSNYASQENLAPNGVDSAGQQRRKSRSRAPAAGAVRSNSSISSKLLFRSSSTSQLSSYYRCDDPSEDLNAVAEEAAKLRSAAASGATSRPPQTVRAATYLPTKTVSCENIAVAVERAPVTPSSDNNLPQTPTNRKPAFPYAFLRSRLSSLPEESNGVMGSGGHHSLNVQSSAYDLNQIKAKMSQMYSSKSEEQDDSGIEKEASSDSSSLYGSDASSGGGQSWERPTPSPGRRQSEESAWEFGRTPRARAASLDNVRDPPNRKWSLISRSRTKTAEPRDTSATTVPAPNSNCTSFLRGQIKSMSFGRGNLTLPRHSSKGPHFQIGQPATGGATLAPPSNYHSSPVSLPPIPSAQGAPSGLPVTHNKQYRMIRLVKDESGGLGILITKKRGPDGSMQGYVIAHIEPGGVADR
jgi:hypothetical protein